jgi:hypothetical protein
MSSLGDEDSMIHAVKDDLGRMRGFTYGFLLINSRCFMLQCSH